MTFLRNSDRRLGESPIGVLVFASILACLFAYWITNPSDLARYMPDTTSYMRFDPYRGAAYPFFLWLSQAIGFDEGGIVHLQLLLFFAGLGWLGLSLMTRVASLTAGIALLIGIGANPLIVQYCFSLITESLFFSSLMTVCGFLLRRGLFESRRCLGAVGALFIWMILIKPVAWAFIAIPVMLIAYMILTRQFRLLIPFIAAMGLMFFAGSAYRFQVHGQWFPGSFLGNQLIGKLAFADFDADQTPYPRSAHHWHTLMKPARDARDDYMETLSMRFIFSLNIYDYLRFQKMPEILQQSSVPPDQHGSALTELAYSIIAQSPEDYAADVWMNWYALWAFSQFQPPELSHRYNRNLDRISPPLPDGIIPYRLGQQNPLVVFGIRSFLGLAFLINMGVLVFFLHRLVIRKQVCQKLLSLATVALMAQGYLLLTALLQAGLIRYAIAVWPIHLLLVIAVLIALFDDLLERQSRTLF